MNMITDNDATITYLLNLISEEHILNLTHTMDLATLVTPVNEKTHEL